MSPGWSHRPGASWHAAREVAAAAGSLPVVETDVRSAAGLVLAEDVLALTDLPAHTASAMDGWAVSGPPPWQVVEGSATGGLLRGTAAAIVTGAPLPQGADAVLRQEDALVDDPLGVVRPTGAAPQPGQDVRRRATECRAGDVVATAGSTCVPAVLGLAAAAGVDRLRVVRQPSVDLLVLGDELLDAGVPGDGKIRDALTPMLLPWLAALGARQVSPQRVSDSAVALAAVLADTSGDLVVTTGSTAGGRHDHLRDVLTALGSELLVDGVDVRPGHPMLLARLADGRRLVGLPGNPLAAVSGLLTLVAPTLRALAGRPAAAPSWRALTEPVTGHPTDVRLIPVRGGRPLHHVGPAMLRGLAAADGLAVVPPGGAAVGDEVEVLALP